jgi:hypothetical protein
MENIFNKKLIAFQSVDIENDIWCNEALLFETEEEVNLFFKNPKKVVEILGLEVEENESINDCIEIFMSGEIINAVKIYLEYCGEKWIKRMSKGFVIRS